MSSLMGTMMMHASTCPWQFLQRIIVWVSIIFFFFTCVVIVVVDNTVMALTNNVVAGTANSMTHNINIDTPYKFVILGGTGKIGTAVAAHLSHRLSSSASTSASSAIEQSEIVLVGRRPVGKNVDDNDDKYFRAALQEIEDLLSLWNNQGSSSSPKISYQYCSDIWKDGALDEILSGPSSSSLVSFNVVSCVIHTAGPYYSEMSPIVLDTCIHHKIPVYVDVSDPIEFLEKSLERHNSAIQSGTTAILAAGAFPGMSNVLAMEAAAVATATDTNTNTNNKKVVVKDVRFNYFTKGLGGSGKVNLYITNLGFGDDMVLFEKGIRTRYPDLSGRLLGNVDFFIPQDEDEDDGNIENENDDNIEDSSSSRWKVDNERAKSRVGSQKVFAWPFPEAATVGKELSIIGSSSSSMGTAPDVWNDMLGFLVDLVPRPYWNSRKFSKLLADFSEPLVLITDLVMKKLSSNGGGERGEGDNSGDCGETHAMRIDVITEETEEIMTTDPFTTTNTTATGSTSTSTSTSSTSATTTTEKMTSIVQCHDSFRICVGQSCAEFALDALFTVENSSQSSTSTTGRGRGRGGGVYLPEQRYRNQEDRTRILSKLIATPGTFCYTGPVTIKASLSSSTINRRRVADDVDVDVDNNRIILKQTSTPGLICNASPIEIRLKSDNDNDNDNRPKTLPVYPTNVREIVEASNKKSTT
mmetsp:Transcript_6733/g.7657  ORF Transcript_6733/g.7657 Transcript_6733/m.7657 type:complete len:697 (+) Transcript_6733:137-2227(+)